MPITSLRILGPFRMRVAALFCAMTFLPHVVSAGTYINFDVDGALGAYATGINNAGHSIGVWWDATNSHCFLRQADGTIITFDVARGSAPYPTAINSAGMIVGEYQDSIFAVHGFLRNLAGEFTTINVPGAGWKTNQGTVPWGINDAGTIVGYYYDIHNDQHGFVRDAAGNYTSFDISDSIGYWENYINESGVITGTFATAGTTKGSFIYRGYIRDTLGNISIFDASHAPYWTFVFGINSAGQVIGSYYYDEVNIGHGFLRGIDGTMTSFDVQTPGYLPYPIGIQDNGDIVGQYQPYNLQVWRGFRRNSSGVITSFRDPDAAFWAVHNIGAGTFPKAVSRNGKIAGFYVDSQGVEHPFVWLPTN